MYTITIQLTNNKVFIDYYLILSYFVVTKYIPCINLPVSEYFLTAGLLTPMYLLASVKLANSTSTFVFIFLTFTVTPLCTTAAADILERVSAESVIPLRASEILSLSASVRTRPVAAKDKFFLVSSLTFLSLLKNSRVAAVCL